MPMPVMKIGIVRMGMQQRSMLVLMGMRLTTLPGFCVLVLVVRIVPMPLGMNQSLVAMKVGMPFGDV
jgi:hypothetical protein